MLTVFLLIFSNDQFWLASNAPVMVIDCMDFTRVFWIESAFIIKATRGNHGKPSAKFRWDVDWDECRHGHCSGKCCCYFGAGLRCTAGVQATGACADSYMAGRRPMLTRGWTQGTFPLTTTSAPGIIRCTKLQGFVLSSLVFFQPLREKAKHAKLKMSPPP